MWIFQLKFIPIVYKELIIHRIKKEFNHKELLVLLVMVRKEHRQMLSFVVTNLFINLNPVNKHPIPKRG